MDCLFANKLWNNNTNNLFSFGNVFKERALSFTESNRNCLLRRGKHFVWKINKLSLIINDDIFVAVLLAIIYEKNHDFAVGNGP
jgi:hypothetical protein